jgi:hypothetical protein
VIGVTVDWAVPCHTCSSMIRKSIAAALLFSMVAWAEIMMTPMLAMQIGHSHQPAMAVAMAAHHAAMPADHASCPRIGGSENPALLELAATSAPCHEEHRCCFRQGPKDLPSPASSGHRFSREIVSLEVVALRPDRAESNVSLATAVAPGSPPGMFGMVLRV